MKVYLPTPKPHYKNFAHDVYAFAHQGEKQAATLAFWLSRLDTKARLHAVVCVDQAQANALAAELAFFGVKAHIFCEWETLVYDKLSPREDAIAERIRLLSDMPKSGVLLLTVSALMQRLAPPSWLLGRYFWVKKGERFSIQSERTRLVEAGYRAVDNVYFAGEFAVRGGIVDVFLIGQPLPVRIELFDDEVERIRFFDPNTQRTLSDEELAAVGDASGAFPSAASVDEFKVLPAKEFPFCEGKETFRRNFAELFDRTSHRKNALYQEVMAGVAPPGIEYYQPLFFEKEAWETGHIFAYLPSDCMLALPENVFALQQKTWERVCDRYENLRHDVDNPIAPPSLLFLPPNACAHLASAFAQTRIGQKGDPLLEGVLPAPDLPIDRNGAEPLGALLDFAQSCPDPVLLVAQSKGRREILLELLAGKIQTRDFADFADFWQNKAQLQGALGVAIAPLERGLRAQGAFCLLSETQIFGRQAPQSRRLASSLPQAFLLKSTAELSEGALVTHIEHGIGRYCGLVAIDAGDGEQEFIHLKYADDASVYVPITNLALIGRYAGSQEEVELSKLGSGKWDKARQKALLQIHDVAAQLLNTQARRQTQQSVAFSIDWPQYELFVSEFAFEETPDQKAAIEAVLFDMQQQKPMDRLICGDVGFGKTEVAMRAAFVAACAGYQVAVLVPTTLLAGQHEDSFRDRFANWPIRVESLSRFGNKKQREKTLADLLAGKVDIVIGTHRLLQEDVRFANLGLMIVDEEHRFGVRHKDRIKQMQASIDCLCMSATPIPRTLNMALSGMQDISVIATAPARRLPIKTFVMEKSNQSVVDVILREILRGGQVYYVHNEVASIELAAENLRKLMPEIRIGVAHGQMKENQLAQVMSDFYHKKTNVLVTSTIVETGIDVPNANTIVIQRADKFGLAQLHQLRGRVGRSHHQAYCYLFVPSVKGLSADAARRLDAISRANTLGAGFTLASEDLQIRGAGELLGKEQSGNMQSVGFELYMDMLNRATKAIKAGKTPSLETALDLVGDIRVQASALIPKDYLGDATERLLLYKRIAACDTAEALSQIRAEMADRFGALPAPTVNLFLVHKARILCHALGVCAVDVSENQAAIEFDADTSVDPLFIVRLLQSESGFRMSGAHRLVHRFAKPKDAPERFAWLFDFLQQAQQSGAKNKPLSADDAS